MQNSLVSLFTTLAVFAVSANAIAPLISTLADTLSIDAANFGYFITLQFLVFSLASFTGSKLKEKFRLTNYHIIAAGLILITFGFLIGPAVLNSPLAIVLWIIPLGFAGGAVETFASTQISALSTSGTSKNLCLSQAFYSVGAFLAPQVVYICFNTGLSWPIVFVIFGITSGGLGLFFILSNKPMFKIIKKTEEVYEQKKTTKTGIFYLLFALMFVYVILESLSAAWLSYIFEITYAMAAKNAALILATFWVGVFAGRLLIAFLPDRFTLWPTLLTASITIFIVSLGLSLSSSLLPLMYILVFLFGISLGPMWPVIVMVSSVDCKSEHLTAAVIGAGAIGFGSGPFLGSFILKTGNESYYFIVQAIFGFVIMILCYTAYLVHTKSPKNAVRV